MRFEKLKSIILTEYASNIALLAPFLSELPSDLIQRTLNSSSSMVEVNFKPDYKIPATEKYH